MLYVPSAEARIESHLHLFPGEYLNLELWGLHFGIFKFTNEVIRDFSIRDVCVKPGKKLKELQKAQSDAVCMLHRNDCQDLKVWLEGNLIHVLSL